MVEPSLEAPRVIRKFVQARPVPAHTNPTANQTAHPHTKTRLLDCLMDISLCMDRSLCHASERGLPRAGNQYNYTDCATQAIYLWNQRCQTECLDSSPTAG